MPALTASEVQEHLSSYVRGGDTASTFYRALNQALPRIYAMGYWRDLTEDVTLTAVDGVIGLPYDFESVAFHLVDDSPSDLFPLWHDWLIYGRLPDGQTDPVYGLIDDGLHATQFPLDGESSYMLAVAPADGDSAFAPAPGTVTFSARQPSGRVETVSFTPSNNPSSSTVDGTATGGVIVIGATDPRANAGGTITPAFRTGDDGDGNPVYLLSSFGGLLTSGPGYEVSLDLLNSQWLANFVNGASGDPGTFVQAWDGVSDRPFHNVGLWYDSDAAVVDMRVIAMSRPASISFGGNGTSAVGVRAIERLSGVNVSSPLDVWAFNMTDGVSHRVVGTLFGTGRMRYRRYRVGGFDEADPQSVRVIAKRRPLLVERDSDPIHLSNLHVLKHGLLGTIAEDNADTDRASYHWAQCLAALEGELDQYRGKAKPRLNIDVWGRMAPIHNAT